jgi:hypothetical protein
MTVIQKLTGSYYSYADRCGVPPSELLVSDKDVEALASELFGLVHSGPRMSQETPKHEIAAGIRSDAAKFMGCRLRVDRGVR